MGPTYWEKDENSSKQGRSGRRANKPESARESGSSPVRLTCNQKFRACPQWNEGCLYGRQRPKVPADLPDRNAVFLRGNGGVHLGFGHFRRPPYWSSRGAPRKDRFPRGTEGSKGEPWLSGPTLYPRSPPRFRSMAAAENVRTLTGPGGHCERRRFHVHIKRRRFHVHIKRPPSSLIPITRCDSKKSVWRGSVGILFFGAGHVSSAPSPHPAKGGAFGKLAKRPESAVSAKAPALKARGDLSSPHGRRRKRGYHPDRFFENACQKGDYRRLRMAPASSRDGEGSH